MRHVYGTLTRAENTPIEARLPLAGYLEVWETSAAGAITSAVFRADRGDGTLQAPAEIGHDFAFAVDSRVRPSAAAAEFLRLAIGSRRINVPQMDIVSREDVARDRGAVPARHGALS